MNILIVEEEPRVAEQIEAKVRKVLGKKAGQVYRVSRMELALEHIRTHTVDICLLDLDTNDKKCYQMLKEVISRSFQTIVLNTNTGKPETAFNNGVIDLDPQPFTEDRLRHVIDGNYEKPHREDAVKYLAVKSANKINLIRVGDVRYFRAFGNYIKTFLTNGKCELLDKRMDNLEKMLPDNFVRIHRSVIVDISQVASYYRNRTGAYQAELHDHTLLPVGRTRLEKLKMLTGMGF